MHRPHRHIRTMKLLMLVAITASILAACVVTGMTYRSMRYTQHMEVVESIDAEFDVIKNSPPEGMDRQAWRIMIERIFSYLSQANDQSESTMTAFESLLDDMKSRRASGQGYRTQKDVLWLHARVSMLSPTTMKYSEFGRRQFDDHMDRVFPPSKDAPAASR